MEAEFDSSTGGIEGLVTDDSLIPLEGAQVGILERDLLTVTDAQGRYSFSSLEPGRVQLAAQRIGFDSSARLVEVQADQLTTANFALAPLAIEEAYHTTQARQGRILCGIAIRPVIGFAACGVVYGTPLNATDTFVVPFQLTAQNVSKVRGMVFETEWRSNQALGTGLSVLWETFQEITAAYGFTEPVRVWASYRGTSPLNAVVDYGTVKSLLKQKPPAKYCPPGGSCRIWARSFPFANTLGPSYPADIAFYMDQRYTHYATEFYGEEPPAVFTVLRDA